MAVSIPLLVAATTGLACAGSPRIAEPWTSWTQSWQADAGTQASGAPSLFLGKPAVVTLTPGDYVQFAVDPGRMGRQGFAGLFSLTLKEPARVGIAVSGPVEIDFVKETVPQPPVGHSAGPSCSGIARIVWFEAQAGRYIVQVWGAKRPEIRIMAADAKANQPR